MKFLQPYKLLESINDKKMDKPWLYFYRKFGGTPVYLLKEEYQTYLTNKYNVETVRLTSDYNGLVLVLLERESYGKDFTLDRDSLMPLITEFNKYNWKIEISGGTLSKCKDFVIKMTEKEIREFFNKLNKEIELKGVKKYNL